MLGAEIATVNTAEGAAYGAATLAAVGAGWAATADDLTRDWVTITSVTEPGSAAPGYHEAHARYQDLYPALHPPL